MTDRSLFADAVDIPLWLEQDRDLPYHERVQRDRRLSATSAARIPHRRVRAWFADVHEGSTRTVGVRLDHARSMITLSMVLIGTLAGAGLAAAVFHYDGSAPVNVVRVLAVIALPQFLLVGATGLLALGALPGLKGLQALIAALNPGAIAGALYRRVANAGAPDELFGWQGSRTATARFARWQVIVWSQAAAVAFNAAAIAMAVALITFTDLAFGWSTTLTIDSGEARAIVHALAWPWRDWLPAAVPTEALIEASRFFRMADGAPPQPARTLTGWWPFVLCALVTYALLPRVLLLTAALLRERAATRALLLDDARVTALLDRMEVPALALDGDGAEVPATEAVRADRHRHPSTVRAARVIVWADSVAREEAGALLVRALGVTPETIAEAGGNRTLVDDRATAASMTGVSGTVVVVVRAFEPPLLDLLDFLRHVRAAVGTGTSILVLPVPAAGEGLSATHLDTWTATIARLDDPATYVEAGA